MPLGKPAPFEIVPAAAEDRAAAIGLLLAGTAAERRDERVAEMLATGAAEDWPGLLVARRGVELAGAIWLRPQPGKIVHLWPPQLRAGEVEATAAALLARVAETLDREGRILAQALLPADHGVEADRLRAAGFEHLTDLLYLVSLQSSFPDAEPTAHLEFEAYRDTEFDRLAALIEQTYEGTRDCPELNGVRAARDVLAGYRDASSVAGAPWLIVRHAARDVGCVLLADHPRDQEWELVYMGLLPGARGRGWGTEMTRQVQWLARVAGVARLVLAVDVRNSAAIEVYAAAGFVTWDRRSVFLRFCGPGRA